MAKVTTTTATAMATVATLCDAQHIKMFCVMIRKSRPWHLVLLSAVGGTAGAVSSSRGHTYSTQQSGSGGFPKWDLNVYVTH